MKRTEDDLRAAFTLAAQQAPSTDDVLARLDVAEHVPTKPHRRPRTRVWLPIAAAAVVVAAIAVPLAITNSNSNRATSSSAGIADSSIGGAKGAASSAAASEGFVVPAIPTGPAGSVTPNVVPSTAVCAPADLTLTVSWTKTGTGLSGTIQAHNISASACNLAVKPAIYPLDANGKRLDVQNISTAEGYAGPSNLNPGATATSTITWASWCGPQAATKAEVEWGAGTATADVNNGAADGARPTTPSCVNGQSGPISSSWFGPLS
jgi:hypothetical protein